MADRGRFEALSIRSDPMKIRDARRWLASIAEEEGFCEDFSKLLNRHKQDEDIPVWFIAKCCALAPFGVSELDQVVDQPSRSDPGFARCTGWPGIDYRPPLSIA